MRDAVLEGALPQEVEVLKRIGAEPAFRPGYYIVRRLVAKGWVDTFEDICVLTLTGRTLADMN